jgi:hypothetical protein
VRCACRSQSEIVYAGVYHTACLPTGLKANRTDWDRAHVNVHQHHTFSSKHPPFLCRERIYSQDELDIVLLGLGDQILDLFSPGLVKERLADLDAVDDLFEGESHSSADDERVDLRRGNQIPGRRFQSVETDRKKKKKKFPLKDNDNDDSSPDPTCDRSTESYPEPWPHRGWPKTASPGSPKPWRRTPTPSSSRTLRHV